MELQINTINNNCEEIEIKLVSNKKIKAQKLIKARGQQAEKLLPGIEKLLSEKNLNIKKIKRIKVVNNGGSFTSLRIGVITANTLGYALGIPVIDFKQDLARLTNFLKNKKNFTIIKPAYNREPNITISKK